MKKKRLVFSTGMNKPVKQFPQQYIGSYLKWLGEVTVESATGVIDEFEIRTSQKLLLNDFLTIVSEKITEMPEDDVVNWGIRIYRV